MEDLFSDHRPSRDDPDGEGLPSWRDRRADTSEAPAGSDEQPPGQDVDEPAESDEDQDRPDEPAHGDVRTTGPDHRSTSERVPPASAAEELPADDPAPVDGTAGPDVSGDELPDTSTESPEPGADAAPGTGANAAPDPGHDSGTATAMSEDVTEPGATAEVSDADAATNGPVPGGATEEKAVGAGSDTPTPTSEAGPSDPADGRDDPLGLFPALAATSTNVPGSNGQGPDRSVTDGSDDDARDDTGHEAVSSERVVAGDGDDGAPERFADPLSGRAEGPGGDAETTVVIPFDPGPARSTRPGSSSPTGSDPWDTGGIRRWDASMTDSRPRAADSAMDRPQPLGDRDEVAVEPEPTEGRWYEIPLMILTALTLAFLLRTFVIQVFYIPSGSMIPTLEINDRIAVEKVTYLVREPARGDVVVFAGDDPFAEPATQSTADRALTGVGQFLGLVPVDAKDFVKRVIGLPGDTVTMEEGLLSVNGVELDEPYAQLDTDSGEWVVPDDMLFVLGDNRANSGDSRTSLGYIADDDVVGRAIVTIWPFDRFGSIPGEDHDAAVDTGS